MADVLDRVLACIDARREDAVELLQELVRVNSVNPAFAGVRQRYMLSIIACCLPNEAVSRVCGAVRHDRDRKRGE